MQMHYVKFHRQTAPVGPGHNPRPGSTRSRLPVQRHTDDLGPPADERAFYGPSRRLLPRFHLPISYPTLIRSMLLILQVSSTVGDL